MKYAHVFIKHFQYIFVISTNKMFFNEMAGNLGVLMCFLDYQRIEFIQSFIVIYMPTDV